LLQLSRRNPDPKEVTMKTQFSIANTNEPEVTTRTVGKRTTYARVRRVTGVLHCVGAVLLTMMTVLSVSRADDSMPVDPGKRGDSTAKGTLVVTIKWIQGGVKKQVSTEVDVPKGKNAKQVADLITQKLGENDQLNSTFKFSDPENDEDKGTYEVTATPNGPGIRVDRIIADTKEGSGLTGLSYGGALAYLDTPIDGEFAVAGSMGQPGDDFAIELFGSAGRQTFELASYAGLTPPQIEADLAAEINQSSGYSAYISNGVVYITGAMDSFRVDFALGDDTQDFSLSAGAFVAPEPGGFALLGSGILGLSGVLRKRLLMRS
jgi:hypothetical protein